MEDGGTDPTDAVGDGEVGGLRSSYLKHSEKLILWEKQADHQT